MELSSRERDYIRLDEKSDGVTFQFRDGTEWYIPPQEFYELLMFISELKSASEQRRREVLG